MAKRETTLEQTRYVLKQILKSEMYSEVEKDIIKAKCTSDMEYTLEEIDNIINDFKKRKVES